MACRAFFPPINGGLFSRLLVPCLFLFWASNVFAASPLPQDVIKKFYKWYLAKACDMSRQKSPAHDDGILQYVSKDTVIGLRARDAMIANEEIDPTADYFLKSNDCITDWASKIHIGKQHNIRGFIVADVVLAGRSGIIFVVLRKEDSEWKIFKVLDMEDWMDL